MAMILTKRNLTITIILSMIIGCTSEEQIESKGLPVRNIPSHIFKININALKDSIASLFSFENQYENKYLKNIFYQRDSRDSVHSLTFTTETDKDTIFSKAYFKQPNTSNDIFIHNFRDPWISKLYYSKDHPLKYVTSFAAHLSRINNDSTMVTIITDRPEVINGTAGYSAHGGVARYTLVQPTSIEEYSLLLFIASKFGDTSLPALKFPPNQ